MRVFCLSTGRCGSTTFARCFEHATNYTSGHETRTMLVGDTRLDYPDWHVESDNRLSWFLGGLARRYGNDPVWVHLTRDRDAVIDSYAERRTSRASIMQGFGHGILMSEPDRTPPQWRDVAAMYVDTVTANIEQFLGTRTTVVRMTLEEPGAGTEQVWKLAGMSGDLDGALATWAVRHNAR